MSTLLVGAAASGGKAATAGLFGSGGQFALSQTLMTAGVATTGYGMVQQGRTAAAQGKFQQEIAARNAAALERQAEAERQAARLDERRVSRKQKFIQASQRAAVGKSGIGLAGASLNVLADTAYQFSMERNLVLREGLVRGRELSGQSGLETSQGRWAKRIGRQEKRGAYVQTAGTILGSAYSRGGFGLGGRLG